MAGKSIRLTVLNIIATITVLSVTLPLFLFVEVFEFKGLGLIPLLIYIATSVALHLFGKLMAYLNKGFEHKKSAKTPVAVFSKLAAILTLVPLIIYTIVFGLHTGFFIYSLPIVIVPFISGYVAYGKNYTGVFTREWLGAFFVSDLFSYIFFMNIAEEELRETGKIVFVIITGAVLITACVLTNQTNIDNQIKQRRDNIVLIPSGLRRFNIGIIAAIAVVMIICFGGSIFVSEGINSGLKAFAKWLISLNKPMSVETDKLDGAQDVPHDFFDLTNNNAMGVIITIVLYALLAFIIVRYGRQIISGIVNFFREYFHNLLERFTKKNDEQDDIPFVDVFEDLDLHSYGKKRKHRTAKDIYKFYKAEQDDVLKFRYGYQLLLMMTNDKNHLLTPYDTTDVQREKASKAYNTENEIKEIVAIYNNIRYMNTFPQKTDLVKMENLINNILLF